MGNKKAVYTHHGILFSPRKEGNPVIGDNTDELGGHHAQ